VAAFPTIGAVIAAATAWRTQLEKDLPVADLRELTDRLQRGDELALRELAHHYLNLVEDRRDRNTQRIGRVGQVTAASILSVALTGLELVLIFIAMATV
jgi:hypothetical protein